MKKSTTRSKSESKKIKNLVETVSSNDNFNIVDILLFDHTYLKECIHILKDDNEDKKIKIKYGKSFLDALKKHTAGEKKALYAPLQDVKDLHSIILKSLIEHGIVDDKVKKLTIKFSSLRSLDDKMQAELKVLAEIVEHHLGEEEEELFPKIRENFKSEILNQMGYQFMLVRKFTKKDLVDSPKLWEEMEEITH